MKKKFYGVVGQIFLLMFIVALANSEPNEFIGSKIGSLAQITGNVVRMDIQDGCVKNVFSDNTLLKIIDNRIDYSGEYHLVAFRGEGNYYLLKLENGQMIDSYGKKFEMVEGDQICYDFRNLPTYVEVLR